MRTLIGILVIGCAKPVPSTAASAPAPGSAASSADVGPVAAKSGDGEDPDCRQFEECCRALLRQDPTSAMMCRLVITAGGTCATMLATVVRSQQDRGAPLPDACR